MRCLAVHIKTTSNRLSCSFGVASRSKPVKITTILFCQPSRIKNKNTHSSCRPFLPVTPHISLQNPIYPPLIKLHTVKLLLSNCRWFSHSTRIFLASHSLRISESFPSARKFISWNFFPQISMFICQIVAGYETSLGTLLCVCIHIFHLVTAKKQGGKKS